MCFNHLRRGLLFPNVFCKFVQFKPGQKFVIRSIITKLVLNKPVHFANVPNQGSWALPSEINNPQYYIPVFILHRNNCLPKASTLIEQPVLLQNMFLTRVTGWKCKTQNGKTGGATYCAAALDGPLRPLAGGSHHPIVVRTNDVPIGSWNRHIQTTHSTQIFRPKNSLCASTVWPKYCRKFLSTPHLCLSQITEAKRSFRKGRKVKMASP